LNFARACGPAADAGCPAQHSDYGDYEPAALAVDGDTSAGTYSLTAGGYNKSWWRVDLQQEISINTLSITGRGGYAAEDTAGFRVHIGTNGHIAS